MSYDLQNSIYEKIHPALAYAARETIIRTNCLGLPFEVFEGLRTPERSHFLYMQGRKLENGVWVLIDPVSLAGVVTFADAWESWHNYGLAVDIVLNGSPAPKLQPSWDKAKDMNKDGINDWMTLGVIGMGQGLAWGGSRKADGSPVFGKIDLPHFQITRGFAIKEAKHIVDAYGLPHLWELIDKAA